MFRPNRFVLGPFPLSFEANEQTVTKIYVPAKCKIRRMRSITTKALAGTDTGTLTLKNAAGSAMANGENTHAISEAIDTSQVCVPTTNNTVPADDFFTVTSAKTTAGGKVLVTIECEHVH